MDSNSNNENTINTDYDINDFFDIMLYSNDQEHPGHENVEQLEEIKDSLQEYLNNYLKESEKIEHYPSHTFMKNNEALTVFYAPEGNLFIPTYLLLDYNKFDVRFILDHNNKELFTEDYAYKFSKYITDATLPDDIQEYIDELNGIEKTPMCKEELLNLNKINYNPEIHTSDKCQICLENFSPDTEVIELECKHVFCHDCLKTYFET